MGNSNNSPGCYFDLSNWRLDTPIQSGSTIKIISNDELVRGYKSKYFYLDSNGLMTFECPLNGYHTINSRYPRSELREIGVPDWSLIGIHELSAQCKVTQLAGGRGIIIGQIHGNSNKNAQLAKLYWRTNNNIELQIKSDENPNEEITLPLGKYILGELISYTMQLTDGNLIVTISSSTQKVRQKASFKNDYWFKQKYYFKAGAYLQNYDNNKQTGIVKFRLLDVKHYFS